MNDIALQTKKMIADYLAIEPESIMDDAALIDRLGLDSLSVMELVLNLEDKFAISLHDDAVASIKTVGDAISAITAAVNAQAAEA